jgi:tetratricopeptide (TPR) repeat protein
MGIYGPQPGLPAAKPAQRSGGGSTPANVPNPATGGGNPGGEAWAGRDHELLGDLHFKQGRYAEAIDAYQSAIRALEEKGVKVSADTTHADARAELERMAQKLKGLYSKQAGAHLMSGSEQKARELLDKARAATLKLKVEESKSGKIPVRLTISATKKLLQQAGSEKMSFEEFKKAAMVEYVEREKK